MTYQHSPKAKLVFKLLNDILTNDLDENLEDFIGEVQDLLNKASEIKKISNEITYGSY